MKMAIRAWNTAPDMLSAPAISARRLISFTPTSRLSSVTFWNQLTQALGE